MGRGSQLEKAARVRRIRELLLEHSQGLRPAELLERLQAERIQVNRSTLWRDLNEMSDYVEKQGDRYVLERSRAPLTVEFRLDEALALYLASRLLVDSTDRRYPDAASGLHKLGLALQGTAPLIGQQVRSTAQRMQGTERRDDPHFVENLRRITAAWAERRMLRIYYRKAPDERLKTHDLAPYFIEPSAVGQCNYLGGRREPPGELRTYKIERIERVEQLDQTYSIPEDFDLHEHFRHAWGVWTTGEQPVEVVLRFSPQAAVRVRESRWHPSEETQRLPDGRLLWRAWVAETTEMLPWIRGWGSGVEVLEPGNLRQQIVEEARQLADLYG